MARPGLPRGTVTFLFTDVEGSTKVLHDLGVEGYAKALAEHRRLLRDAVRQHGGVEVDTQGDAFFFVFPTAPGALAAARDGGQALGSGPIQVRMGLHTGTAYLGDEGYVGSDVHLGARVGASGHGGQVLLTKATRELVAEDCADLGEHRVKDFSDPVWIFQLGSERFPPLRTISNTNLPRPASSFVGRERERAEVSSIFRDGARLVTLLGPGGAGKTRLAIEAAAELVPDFRNGVFWVGLAPLRDAALVPEAIGLEVGAKDGLADHIGERELLLLLDNFEQVVDAATDVSSLLSACPSLRVLVTSRELLRIDGERGYLVPPLAEHDAVDLFCQRSGLEPEAAVAELCSRLDNLPLALELAAARGSVLSPTQILDRLSQRLDLLKGRRDADPRQKTLRATIAWSHDLLDDAEQGLFARLAVFRGGCTLDAAEEVAGATSDLLQSLVEKSLLRHTNERFWMLETIREYALERLAESGGEADVVRRHATYYLRFAEEAGPNDSEVAAFPQWLARVETEHDNVRRALEWARDRNKGEILLRLTAAVADYWRVRGHYREARTWLELALERGASPSKARLEVLGQAAFRALEDGDLARAAALTAEFRSAAEHAGDDVALMKAMNQSAHLAGKRGDLEGAQEGFVAVKTLAAELGDRGLEAAMAVNLGMLAIRSGNFRAGLEHSREAAAGFRETGEHGGTSAALMNCGWSALGLGDPALAESSFREGLAVADRLGAPPRVANGAEGLGAALVARSDEGRGAELLGAASSLREELGMGFYDAFEERIHEGAVADAKAALGKDAFAAAWARGQAMTAKEIVELALNAVNESA
jgi:predicted ATPase/class 3 adenylate cyclase